MNHPNGFYTMKGYTRLSDSTLTSAMEDYLEMITRISQSGNAVRVNDISRQLHVKASSVTKMVQHLAENGYVHAPKYGDIILTAKGLASGNYLLHRHDILHRFLCLLNHSQNELEQVEKIEHFLNEKTIKNLELLILQLQQRDSTANDSPSKK